MDGRDDLGRLKKGSVPSHKLPVGSETIRKDKGRGKPRVYRKVAEPNVWQLRALIVWKALNGPVPKGCVIHHKDRDSMNDMPKNLECLTRAEHAREHAKDQPVMLAKSGEKYVYPNRKGRMVRIRVDGKNRHFGTYSTIEEAACVARQFKLFDSRIDA